MTLSLDEMTVGQMIAFVDRNVRRDGCDHTHRFTSQWSRENQIKWEDLLDGLEQHGAFCDCEMVLNLEGASLLIKSENKTANLENPWLLPPEFTCSIETNSRILVARAGVGKNNHAFDGEWLVPAPMDAKPRKRVRKAVHFFIGVESGMPTEVGFVQTVPAISLAEFSQKIRESTVPELRNFDDRIAGFLAQRLASMPDGVAVGTDIMERVGVATKQKELTIHRIHLRS